MPTSLKCCHSMANQSASLVAIWCSFITTLIVLIYLIFLLLSVCECKCITRAPTTLCHQSKQGMVYISHLKCKNVVCAIMPIYPPIHNDLMCNAMGDGMLSVS